MAMTVDATNVVDFVTYSKFEAGPVTLIIVDHLPWEDIDGDDFEREHAWVLQEKINSYLMFIESGQLVREYPAVAGKDVVIKIIANYPLSPLAQRLIDYGTPLIRKAGYDLVFERASTS
jgi:hypothetical protein